MFSFRQGPYKYKDVLWEDGRTDSWIRVQKFLVHVTLVLLKTDNAQKQKRESPKVWDDSDVSYKEFCCLMYLVFPQRLLALALATFNHSSFSGISPETELGREGTMESFGTFPSVFFHQK